MDLDMVDMVDTEPTVSVWDIGAMVLAMAMDSMAVKSDLRIKELYTLKYLFSMKISFVLSE